MAFPERGCGGVSLRGILELLALVLHDKASDVTAEIACVFRQFPAFLNELFEFTWDGHRLANEFRPWSLVPVRCSFHAA